MDTAWVLKRWDYDYSIWRIVGIFRTREGADSARSKENAVSYAIYPIEYGKIDNEGI
jgi:hypothetical protein